MRPSKLFTLRWARSKRCAVVLAIAMAISPMAPSYVAPTVHAQQQVAPVGQGFVIDATDLRFIYQQILVAQDHASRPSADCPTCGTLLGSGPNQVADPQLPRGLRTVDGTYNNLVPSPDQHMFGAADRLFPRVTTRSSATRRTARHTSGVEQRRRRLEPRFISNDRITSDEPAAPCVAYILRSAACSDPPNLAAVTDPASGALFIPNITPDFGLSAPFNVMFAFFGQFFDHGLDLVTKGGGAVMVPLKDDDPLVAGKDGIFGNADDLPPDLRFMVITRGQNQPGPDGIVGTADDVQETINETTPWVDQNQTYTSHPSHQVFLREYGFNAGKPVQTGLVLDGGFCAPRPTGIPGDNICNIGNWAEVKLQAATKLGIQLVDTDVLNVPLVVTDPYGHFKPGPNGFPQLVLPGNVLMEGNPGPNPNGGFGITIPPEAFRTGHAFLNDIAHNAVPAPGLTPDLDGDICDFRIVPSCQAPGTYDDELLNAHFITGDGRGNENIGLTMVHNLCTEHNRLRTTSTADSLAVDA